MGDGGRSDRLRRSGAPPGHAAPERPLEDNPYIKLDGPRVRRFSEQELTPLRDMLCGSLASESVNALVNEALRAVPHWWIRLAGVHLPELGSPLRSLAIGPNRAFIITVTNGAWTHDGLLELERAARAVDRPRTTSRRRGCGSPSRRLIPRFARRCSGSPAPVASG